MIEERMPERMRPKREATIDRLREHYAQDDLEIDEFEQRVDDALRATSIADLEKLVSDLPTLPPPQTLPQVAPDPGLPGLVPPDRVRQIGFTMAFLGGSGRKGRWIPPRRLFSVFYLGGGELDFRDVLFVHAVTDIYVVAFLGGLNVIVPPGYAVEINGIPFLGGYGCSDDVGVGAGPSSPLISIRGIFFLGGGGVEMRYPGESEKEAKERRKAEKQARKRVKE